MPTSLRRCLASIAIAVMIASAGTIAHTDAAHAVSEETPAEPVFEVFPHEGNLVNFWDSWGARRSGGRRHQGTDIMSPQGTPIRAVADGVVTELGWSRLSGFFIRVAHDGDWMTVMMHLNNDLLGHDNGEGGTWSAFFPTLLEGDAVSAGQILGYVGDSGNAEGTRPHTHFELRIGDQKVNPYPFLLDVWNRERRFVDPAGDLLSF